jgi:hypothetical protein
MQPQTAKQVVPTATGVSSAPEPASESVARPKSYDQCDSSRSSTTFTSVSNSCDNVHHPQAMDSRSTPTGIFCEAASALLQATLFLSRILLEPFHSTTSLLNCLFYPLGLVGAKDILKRMTYEISMTSLTQAIDLSPHYVRLADQRERYELAQHCLALAIHRSNLHLQQLCSPKYFGIDEIELKKNLLRMRATYGSNQIRFGIQEAQEINTCDESFRVEMLAKALGRNSFSKQFYKAINLTPENRLAAHKMHLQRLESAHLTSRQSWISQAEQLAAGNLGASNEFNLPVEILSDYMRLMPEETCKGMSLFGYLHQADRFRLALQAAKLGCPAVLSQLGCYVLSRDQELEVKQTIQETNLAGAQELGGGIDFPLKQDSFEKLLAGAIQRGRWTNALLIYNIQQTAAKNLNHSEHQDVNPFSHRHQQMSRELPLELLGSIKAAGLVDAYMLNSLVAVQSLGVKPTDNIGTSLLHFSRQDSDFLIGILKTYGATFGGSVLNQLTKIFPAESKLQDEQRRVISAFLSHGFRGLSPLSFSLYEQEWQQSPVKAERLMSSWKESEGKILNGTSIDPSQMQDPLFVELVYSAFRPAEMTLEDTKNALLRNRDHNQHCIKFTAPTDGYHVTANRSTPDRHFATTHALYQPLQHLIQAKSLDPLSPAELQNLLIRALLLDLVTPRNQRWRLLHSLCCNVKDETLADVFNDLHLLLSEDESSKPSLEQQLHGITLMSTLLEKTFPQMLEDALSDGVINKVTPKENKLQQTTRRILRMGETSALAQSEIRLAIQVQLSKLFDDVIRALNAERRTIQRQINRNQMHLFLILTKNLPSYLGRASAHLCSAECDQSWASENFLQMNLVDKDKRRIVGNVQLHCFTDPNNQPAVLARINPTSSVLKLVDPQSLADSMIEALRNFCLQNNLGLYLPDQQHEEELLTNRTDFLVHLQAFYGGSISCNVWLFKTYFCRKAFRVSLSK